MTGGSVHSWAYADDDAPDRDTWCTPKWLARAVGEWDVDACTNDRSHIVARILCDLHGNPARDGLKFSRFVGRDARVWCNPPYSRGQVIKFVNAYRHTRFCFLVRFDPSTTWFEYLWRSSALVCIPHERINFEAPPGVELQHETSNPFPHGLFYANADDVTDAVRKLCYVMQPRKEPI